MTTPDDTDEQPAPWEQRDDESVKAYEAFCIYKRQGYGRSISAVARELDKNRRHIGKWSADYEWDKRVRAWVAHDTKAEREAFLEEGRKAARNDARVLNAVIGKVGAAVMALDPTELTPERLTRLLDVAMKHRRALYGNLTADQADEAGVELDGLAIDKLRDAIRARERLADLEEEGEQ